MSSPPLRRFRGFALAAEVAGAGLLALLATLGRPVETQDRIARLRAAGNPRDRRGSAVSVALHHDPRGASLRVPIAGIGFRQLLP